MKILITGNMGYVGPITARHLRSTIPYAYLAGYDTGYFGNCINNPLILPESILDAQYFGDIRDVSLETLEDVDAVIHLAGISNDPIGNRFEAPTIEINHHASVDLAKKAKRSGVGAFVFASSCSMYGAGGDAPKAEDSPLNPLTAYAKSKVYTERDLEPLASDRFRVTCLRFATACGMSDRLRLDLVLNDFVAAAIASNRILILSDGSPWRPLVNVKDMARAIEWAIMRDVANGGSFLAMNIGSSAWNHQVKDLAEAVAEAFPGVEVSINPDAQPDKRSYRVNFDLFELLAPNHQPKMNLASTIQELKTGLEAIDFTDPHFRDSRFMRLRALSELIESKLLDDQLRWRTEDR